MGVFGWTVLDPSEQTLEGIVQWHGYSGGVFGDGDWNLKVVPDPGFEWLAVNHLNYPNAPDDQVRNGGHVECEIEPLDALGGGGAEQLSFGPLMNKKVKIVGVWVEDDSHSNGIDLDRLMRERRLSRAAALALLNSPAGIPLMVMYSKGSKTEIHPITSIEIDRGLLAGGRLGDIKEVELFVFSDDSYNWPGNVPFSGENRTGHFSIPFRPAPAAAPGLGQAAVPVRQGAEVPLEDRAVPSNNRLTIGGNNLEVVIESGRPQDHLGFYHGKVLLWWETALLTVSPGPSAAPEFWQRKKFLREPDGTTWSIVYDVRASVSVTTPSSATWRNVLAKLRRRGQLPIESPTVARGGGFDIYLPEVRLTRDGAGFDYSPILEVGADLAVQGVTDQPVAVGRVINLPIPKTDIIVIDPPDQVVGRREDNQFVRIAGAPAAQVAWTVHCNANPQNFLTSPGLRYEWTLIPWLDAPGTAGAGPAGPPLPVGTGPGVQLELVHALPNKDIYCYQLFLTVTDGRGIEQATVAKNILLPRPDVRIVGTAGPRPGLGRPFVIPGRAGTSLPSTAPRVAAPAGGTAVPPVAVALGLKYRFTGEAAPSRFFLGQPPDSLGQRPDLIYLWEIVDPEGWAVAIQGPANLQTVTVDFNYELPPNLGVPGGPPPEIRRGPRLKVTVTDEAGQRAEDSLEIAMAVSEVGLAVAREMQRMQRLLDRSGRLAGGLRQISPPKIPTGLRPPGSEPRPAELTAATERQRPDGRMLATIRIPMESINAILAAGIVGRPQDVHREAVRMGKSLGPRLEKPGRPRVKALDVLMEAMRSTRGRPR